MLRRLTAILLLVALMSTNFSRFFAYAGFELNHKYIAENLCINKNRPWLHCNGKCYLMKKLKEARDNERKQEREDQKNLFQEALPAQLSVSDVTFTAPVVRMSYPHQAVPQPVERSYTILQPPRAA